MTGNDTAGDAAAADFARRFSEYWKAPTPAGLETVLAEQVRLVAPLTPVAHTLAEGQRAFAELFELRSRSSSS